MTGGQAPRDWDKEMAQIDKLIASGATGGPQSPPAAAPPGAAAPAPPGRAPVPAAAPRLRGDVFKAWLRLLLAMALGVGITQWPYARGCGVLLYGYLGAVAGVIVAGLWSAVWSWRTRSAFAHALSLGLVAWGALLGAREVLPRVGYARTSADWLCPADGAAAPRSAPARTPATPAKPQGVF